jgi:hypothetical protein
MGLMLMVLFVSNTKRIARFTGLCAGCLKARPPLFHAAALPPGVRFRRVDIARPGAHAWPAGPQEGSSLLELARRDVQREELPALDELTGYCVVRLHIEQVPARAEEWRRDDS